MKLGGTSGDCLVQSPLLEHALLEKVAQAREQMGFQYLQAES